MAREQTRHAEQREIEAQQWREEQRRETAKDLRTRFIAAAAQLADEKAAIRRVGAYVIAGLADDWYAFGNDVERQVCIDVLTGYLITPNRTYADAGEATPASAGDDGTVRATIVRLLADHRAASKEAGRTGMRYAVTGADPRAVSLHDADVRGADLRQVNLAGANLRSADLTGADMFGAELTGACLDLATLRGAELSRARLCDTSLLLADLRGADLGGGDPDVVEILRIRITNAVLRGAKLDGVDLRGLDLRGADLTGARLEGARHDHSTIWPDGFTPPAHDASAE